MTKKRKIITAVALSLVAMILIILVASNAMKPNKELYSYGNKLEKMDIPPNTVVARYNGEEILFYEVEKCKSSLNHGIKNGNPEFAALNPFYEVLKNKAYRQMAIEYKNYSNYNLNVNDNLEKSKSSWENATYDEQEELLKAMCIERDEIWLDEDDFITLLQKERIDFMLVSKGLGIVNDKVYENPELADNKLAVANFKLHRRLNSNNAIVIMDNLTFGSRRKSYLRLGKAYLDTLISQADIELCVDEHELSYTVPEIVY